MLHAMLGYAKIGYLDFQGCGLPWGAPPREVLTRSSFLGLIKGATYESDAEVIARRAMAVAADLCVFTNDRVTLETI